MATSHVSLIKTWQWISHLCGCMSHVRRTAFHTDRISMRKPLTSVMCLMRLKCSIFPARHLGNINHNVINSPVRSCAPLVALAVCADVAMWTVFKLTQIWVGVCHVCVCLSSSGCSNWFSSQRESKGSVAYRDATWTWCWEGCFLWTEREDHVLGFLENSSPAPNTISSFALIPFLIGSLISVYLFTRSHAPCY